MPDYDALISEYRSLAPATAKDRLVNWLAYALGFFLLMAPFLRGFALPMAVVSLLYFFSVFFGLLVLDFGKVASKRLRILTTEIVPAVCKRFEIPFVRKYLTFWFQLSQSFRRNALAWRRALALWETRFFSVSPASPNVFPSSAE